MTLQKLQNRNNTANLFADVAVIVLEKLEKKRRTYSKNNGCCSRNVLPT